MTGSISETPDAESGSGRMVKQSEIGASYKEVHTIGFYGLFKSTQQSVMGKSVFGK